MTITEAEQIEKFGFKKNTKVVNGFIPHYKKGNDFLFIIGSDFFMGKIYRINRAFKNHNGKVYGLLTDKSPGLSDKDWVTAPNLTLLKLNPLSVGRWSADGMEIEFVKTTI